MIRTRAVDGYDALTLTGEGGLAATFVPGAGMVGCSLRDGGAELLGQRRGLGAYVAKGSTMGIPLLYPWANRLSRDRFGLGGREVDLGVPGLRLKRDANGLAMHGLLTAAPGWRVDEHRSTDKGGVLRASFAFGGDGPLLAAFPFPHEVRYVAELTARTLTIALTVEPTGDVSVPIAFGFHPYLSLPGVPRAEWLLEAPVATRLALDERGLPTGAREPAGPEAGPGGGRRIELAFLAGYPYAQLYAPADDPLIAIEPMTAPTDALATGGHLPFAAPGESFTARFRLAVAEAA